MKQIKILIESFEKETKIKIDNFETAPIASQYEYLKIYINWLYNKIMSKHKRRN